MNDRPTTPDPEAPRSADATPTPEGPDTSVLPAQQPAGAAPGWAASPGGASAPAGGPPGWPAGSVPATSAAAPAGGPGRWWGDATSTTGGKVAVVAAALFGTLLLLAGIGLAAALVSNVGDRHDEWMSVSDGRGPGNNGNGNGQGNGKGQGRGNDHGMGGRQQGDELPVPGPNGMPGYGYGYGNGNGNGKGNGNGMGMGRGAAGLDDVLHGEYTTNVTGTPTVMVVQSGQVTAYTAGASLTVKSADGFEATYVLDDAVATTRTATPVAVGAQVRVLAAKEGLKVTRLVVVG